MGGSLGAGEVVKLLSARGVMFEVILDEGGVIFKDGIPPFTSTPVAIIGTSEKVRGPRTHDAAYFSSRKHDAPYFSSRKRDAAYFSSRTHDAAYYPARKPMKYITLIHV